MPRHCLKAVICIGVLCGGAPALAADLDPPGPLPPPMPVQVVDRSISSCFYARVDVGGAFHERPSVSKAAVGAGGGFAGGGTLDAVGESIRDTAFFEGGVGCQLTESLRVDFTGGARLRQSLRDPFGSLDAELQSYTAFANVYYDITNYGGWTPYLGGGIGVAYHRISDVVTPVDSSSGEEVDFAWNIQAGLSYDITPNAKVDVGYRLADLGKAKSGGPVPMFVDELVTHEFRIGLRYQFGG